MRIKRPINFAILLILGLTAGCASVNPPSETLDDYIERPEIEEELMELYFYPSTVRMLDKFISQGSGGILEGVEEGRLFYTQSDSVDILNRDKSDLREGLETEGFELLAEFRSGDMNTIAYVRDRSVDRYVVLVGGTDVATMLVEMKGEISMETLKGLSDLNSANVMSLLDMTKGEEKKVEDAESSDNANEDEVPTADSTHTETIKIEI